MWKVQGEWVPTKPEASSICHAAQHWHENSSTQTQSHHICVPMELGLCPLLDSAGFTEGAGPARPQGSQDMLGWGQGSRAGRRDQRGGEQERARQATGNTKSKRRH